MAQAEMKKGEANKDLLEQQNRQQEMQLTVANKMQLEAQGRIERMVM